MADDQTRKETEPAGAEDDTPSEEFARSDRIKPDAPPAQPAAPAPLEPAVAAAAEDSADASTEVAEPGVDDERASEDATTPDEAPEQPTEIIEEGVKAPRTGPPLVPILAVTTAVFFIATVLFGLMAFAPRIAPIKSGPAKLAARAQEEEKLKTIAKRFAENFVSVDYKTLEADFERMTTDATSSFAKQLRDAAKAIKGAFQASKATSSGKALNAGVLSFEADSAVVRVVIRRTKKNVGSKGPETGDQIVDVTLIKTDDGWKVNDMRQLGADTG